MKITSDVSKLQILSEYGYENPNGNTWYKVLESDGEVDIEIIINPCVTQTESNLIINTTMKGDDELYSLDISIDINQIIKEIDLLRLLGIFI